MCWVVGNTVIPYGKWHSVADHWWILLPSSSATLVSSTAACRGLGGYYMTSSTGSTSQTEYDSSSPCWCIGLFMERLHRSWWTAAHQPPTLLVVSICGPPVSGSWSFRVITWTVSVVGVLLLRARRPGIRYPTIFATQHWSSLNMFRRQLKTYFFCEILTRCTQRIRDRLIMCYINLHFTYLLTYSETEFH